MAELVKVNDNKIIAVKHNKDKKDLPKPFENEIFLLSTYLTWSDMNAHMNIMIDAIDDDDVLDMFRNPENENDPYNIYAKRQGNIVGNIPRHDNKILARLMDAGKLLYAKPRSASKSYIDETAMIDVDIYMKE